MPFCTNCGATLSNNHKFCGECGTPVASLPNKVSSPASPPPISSPRTPQVPSSVPSKSSSADLRGGARAKAVFSAPRPLGSVPSNTASNGRLPTVPQPPPQRALSPPPANRPGPSPPRENAAPAKTQEAPKKEEKKEGEGRGSAQKKEDEYIKNKENQKQLDDYRRRRRQQSMLAKTVDHVNCECYIAVTGYEIRMKNGKPDFVVFKIEVAYDEADWTIFRRWGQITDMDAMFRKEVRGYTDCLAKIEKPKNKFDENFLRARCDAIQDYLNIVRTSRGAIFVSQVAGLTFFRFLAPTQMGDIKGPGFILPFKLDAPKK